MQVYIVFGQEGSCEDKVEWPVCVYQSEELADKHCELANARTQELVEPFMESFKVDCPAGSNKWDPNHHYYYTDTGYFVSMVPLREQLP